VYSRNHSAPPQTTPESGNFGPRKEVKSLPVSRAIHVGPATLGLLEIAAGPDHKRGQRYAELFRRTPASLSPDFSVRITGAAVARLRGPTGRGWGAGKEFPIPREDLAGVRRISGENYEHDEPINGHSSIRRTFGHKEHR